jgi:hypothetical protein
MPNNKTKNILIVLILIDLILVIVFSGLYFYMKKQNIDSVNKEDQIKSEIKKQEARGIMKNDLNDAKIYGDKIKEFMVGEGDIVGFIKILEDMVSTTGLKSEVKSVSTESSDNLNLINGEYIRVKLDVTGEWNNIQAFLKLLENYPLKIDINKISLSKFSDYESKTKIIPQWLGSFEFTVVKIKDVK